MAQRNREDPTSVADRALDGFQLRECGHARLIGQNVLALPHRIDRQGGTIPRHGRNDDEIDAGVVQQRILAGGGNGGEALAKSLQNARVRGFRPIAGTDLPGIQQPLSEVVDVPMIEPYGREACQRIPPFIRSGCPTFRAGATCPPGELSWPGAQCGPE